MLNIELNPQAVGFLIYLLNSELETDNYGETSKGIMRHILGKLEDEKELPPVSLKDII